MAFVVMIVVGIVIFQIDVAFIVMIVVDLLYLRLMWLLLL